MRAAELQFPSPSNSPSWLEVAINVFNDQVGRWDTHSCGGGLRWQIFTFNQGYNYKQTLSNGAFFQLAARLARYTGNQTYADWATKSYDWTSSVGFISDDYRVFDGASTRDNCSELNRVQWTYAAGAFMYGSAVMTNFVRSSLSALPELTLTATRQTQTRHGRLVQTSCSQQCPCFLQRKIILKTLPLILESCLRRPVSHRRLAMPTCSPSRV